MIDIDEEVGLNRPTNDNDNDTDEDAEISGHITFTSDARKLTNDSLSSTNVSDSEYLDFVSEMTPLVGQHDVEVTPLPSSYGGAADARRYPLTRMPSDESINTVTALPDMVIRCHSINYPSRRRGTGEGTCVIRPSTTKVVSSVKMSQLQLSVLTWRDNIMHRTSLASLF